MPGFPRADPVHVHVGFRGGLDGVVPERGEVNHVAFFEGEFREFDALFCRPVFPSLVEEVSEDVGEGAEASLAPPFA